jgi:hypothetical protein
VIIAPVVIAPVIIGQKTDDKWGRRGFLVALATLVLGTISWLYPQAPSSPPVATAPVRIAVSDDVKLTEALDARITPRPAELYVGVSNPTVIVSDPAS